MEATGSVLRHVTLHVQNAEAQIAAYQGIGQGAMARALSGMRQVVLEAGEPVESVDDILVGASELLAPQANEIRELIARGGVPSVIKLTDEELSTVRQGLADLGFNSNEIPQIMRKILRDSRNEVPLKFRGTLGVGHSPQYELNRDGTAVGIYFVRHYPPHWHLEEEEIILVRGGIKDHRGTYKRSSEYRQLLGTLHYPEAIGPEPAFFIGVIKERGVAVVPEEFYYPVDLLVDRYASRSKIPLIFDGVPARALDERGQLAGLLTTAIHHHHWRVRLGLPSSVESDPEALLDQLIRMDPANRVACARQHFLSWSGEGYLRAT